ncbi:hypothetical protein C0216_12250 [Streptomyces globosus]|uniref:Uncharacterized protein n=2 Tax=Streptomyces globosus TaxID=68209 RepID=A0A344TZQ5_9ACTN|nr:hypothetical protein C0216_12250 [Streptomyces globosus]
MDLCLVDPAQVVEAPFTKDDWAAALLRCLARPSEEQPPARLRGFLFREGGLLRPYMDSDEAAGVIAAGVRPGGALTALLSALPSLLGKEWRTPDGADDPHCRYLVDLTRWRHVREPRPEASAHEEDVLPGPCRPTHWAALLPAEGAQGRP